MTRGGKWRDEIIIWRVNSKSSNTLDFGDHLSAVALCGLWSWTVSVKRRGSDAVAEKVVGFKEAWSIEPVTWNWETRMQRVCRWEVAFGCLCVVLGGSDGWSSLAESEDCMAVGWKNAWVGDRGEVGAPDTSHPLILSLAAPSSPFHSGGIWWCRSGGWPVPVEFLWVDLDS